MNIYIAGAIGLVLGLIAGIIFSRPFVIGRIVIDSSSYDKDKAAFQFDKPVADIFNHRSVTFTVVRK